MCRRTAHDSHTMSTTEARERTINLGAGPSMLPTSVLLEASKGIVDYEGTGMGVTELSHRSSTFKKLLSQAEADLRTLLDIPQEYAVLFLQGGGTEQFSATLLNLLALYASKNRGRATPPPVDYVLTGTWSNKAVKEAHRLTSRVNVVCDIRPTIQDPSASIPAPETWKLSSLDDAPAMLYYCDNETIDGFEMPMDFIQRLPKEYRERVPIVADCSSNILSRPIDVRAHSLIFFGAQKNIGPSGTTIVIVRRDLVVDPDAVEASYLMPLPTTLVYKHYMDNDSLYNTPPMFPIYISSLVFKKLLDDGGIKAAQERAETKSKMVYDALEAYPTVYKPTVAHAHTRSHMNLTFRILDKNTGSPSEEAEAQFVALCAEHHILQVKGHRSVGGIRTSLYNAVTIEQAQCLVDVLHKFASA